MSRDFSPLDFLELGTELKRRKVSTDNVNHCRFKTWFGIDWNLMSVVWHLLWSIGWMARLKQQANPKHLLWTLLFLKEYKKEGDHAADFEAEEKTVRKWVWFYAEGIAALVSRVVSGCCAYSYNNHCIVLTHLFVLFIPFSRKIKLNRRFLHDNGELCLLTVDGTDFQIQEPWPFDKDKNLDWFSHKFHAAAVRYELGITMKTGDICWFCGPFPARIPDITIFRMRLKHRLGP